MFLKIIVQLLPELRSQGVNGSFLPASNWQFFPFENSRGSTSRKSVGIVVRGVTDVCETHSALGFFLLLLFSSLWQKKYMEFPNSTDTC